MHSRYMLWGTGVASLAETTVLPVPIEVVLAPLMQSERRRMWWLATAALLGCLLGGLAIYLAGMLLFDSLGLWLLESFNYTEEFKSFNQRFANNAFWVILMVGVTPIPFQVAALASGAASYPWWLFLIAAAIARGVRYYGLATIVWWKGDQAQAFIKRHKKTSMLIGVVVIGGGWAMMKLL